MTAQSVTVMEGMWMLNLKHRNQCLPSTVELKHVPEPTLFPVDNATPACKPEVEVSVTAAASVKPQKTRKAATYPVVNVSEMSCASSDTSSPNFEDDDLAGNRSPGEPEPDLHKELRCLLIRKTSTSRGECGNRITEPVMGESAFQRELRESMTKHTGPRIRENGHSLRSHEDRAGKCIARLVEY